MSEPRLYLYRKAGREVWDAEMWFPDGRRRVWRTGMADRGDAEAAARARLKVLVGVPTEHPPKDAGGTAAARAVGLCDTDATDTNATAECIEGVTPGESAPGTGGSDGDADGAAAVEAAGAVSALAAKHAADDPRASAFSRFDRWFFAELASLWRARP